MVRRRKLRLDLLGSVRFCIFGEARGTREGGVKVQQALTQQRYTVLSCTVQPCCSKLGTSGEDRRGSLSGSERRSVSVTRRRGGAV